GQANDHGRPHFERCGAHTNVGEAEGSVGCRPRRHRLPTRELALLEFAVRRNQDDLRAARGNEARGTVRTDDLSLYASLEGQRLGLDGFDTPVLRVDSGAVARAEAAVSGRVSRPKTPAAADRSRRRKVEW